jgi:hypothetical protein
MEADRPAIKLFPDRDRVPARDEPGPDANRNPGNSSDPDHEPPHSLENPCMVDELRKPGTIQWGPEPRAWPASAHSAPSALIESLQRLRDRVLERLDSIETLARQRSASAPGAAERAGLERTLERKLADIEETERRLRTQAERQEKEWIASLTQLEADRRLLAEAWERVEQDRIAYANPAEPQHRGHAQGQGPQNGVPAARPHAGFLVAARSAAGDSEPNQPVAQAVLRQFQTLCSDVRRNAEERCDSR